jgi:hypothetical protein
MPPGVAEYLSEVTLRVEAHLEQRLAGAWLIGSGALGDFDRMRSDVDVQAVSTTRLARAELERLAAALSHRALTCPARGLEFVLYAREDLEDPHGPAFQLNLNTGPRMRHHAGYDPDAEPRFWFTLDVAIARERARPLAGRPPTELLPTPPRPLVLTAAGSARVVSRPRRCAGGACRVPGLGVGDAGTLAVEARRGRMGRRSAAGPGAGRQGPRPSRRPRRAGAHSERGRRRPGAR